MQANADSASRNAESAPLTEYLITLFHLLVWFLNYYVIPFPRFISYSSDYADAKQRKHSRFAPFRPISVSTQFKTK